MAARNRKPSPVLGAAAVLIEEADSTFVAALVDLSTASRPRLKQSTPIPDRRVGPSYEEGLRALGQTMQAEGQLQPVLVRRAPGRRAPLDTLSQEKDAGGQLERLDGRRSWRLSLMVIPKWRRCSRISSESIWLLERRLPLCSA